MFQFPSYSSKFQQVNYPLFNASLPHLTQTHEYFHSHSLRFSLTSFQTYGFGEGAGSGDSGSFRCRLEIHLSLIHNGACSVYNRLTRISLANFKPYPSRFLPPLI